MSVCLSVCSSIYLFINPSIYLSIGRFVCLRLSLCVPFMRLVVCHLVTVRLNEEVEASKCGNGDIREFSNVKCQKQNMLARVRNRGKSTNWWGGRNKTRREEKRLLSGAHLSATSHSLTTQTLTAVCISLPFTTVTSIWTALSYVILRFWPIFHVT